MIINILILINPNIFKPFHELIYLKSDPKPAPHIDTQLTTFKAPTPKAKYISYQFEGLKT